MPKRPSPGALLERERPGQGRDAVYGGNGAKLADKPSSPARATWEERHKRVTFHCPLDLLDLLEAEVRSSGRKKNSVIVDALRAHLHQR